jgi:hypothetical protein
MSATMTIEGMSDCLRWCDKAPEDMVKLAKKAMREGGKAVTKGMRPKIDARWRKLIKYKVTGGRNDKDLNCGIGLFNAHQQQGKQPAGSPVDDWFKAYWKNYGTLTRRDPNHRFDKPIKHAGTAAASRRRNNVGQPHENFFEGALEGYEDAFFNAFARTIAENIEDCYDR